MADPANFLARWSRLKRKARTAPASADRAVSPPAAPDTAAAPAELPPVESLTAESDFSVFMQPGVPEAARNAALQKLWRSDPVFANLDGLVEYGEDFAADFKSTALVRTVYRVLQGMPGGDEAPADKVAPSPDSSNQPPAEATSSPPLTRSATAQPLPPATKPPIESATESATATSGRTPKDGLG